MRARLVSIEERGTTTVNGRALRPGSVARLWLYSHYHHRELAKLRQLRALQGFEPLVYRLEFLEYLSAIVGEVAALCDFIITAQELGHLGTIPQPRRSWLHPLAPSKCRVVSRLRRAQALSSICSAKNDELPDPFFAVAVKPPEAHPSWSPIVPEKRLALR